jgi:hypothetical protein
VETWGRATVPQTPSRQGTGHLTGSENLGLWSSNHGSTGQLVKDSMHDGTLIDTLSMFASAIHGDSTAAAEVMAVGSQKLAPNQELRSGQSNLEVLMNHNPLDLSGSPNSIRGEK